MQPARKIVIISSISGGGKTTLIRLVRKKNPQLRRVITTTTRPPRDNEVDGIDYHFIDEDTFQNYRGKDYFIEYAQIYGHYYGVRKESLIKELESGGTLLINMDFQGLKKIKETFPREKIVSIFISPVSNEIWKKRLLQREKTQLITKEIGVRIKDGYEELKVKDYYDHIVINDLLEDAANDILAICEGNGS